MHHIADVNQSLFKNCVEIAAANVLDIAALIDPSKVIAKIKYHLLTHLKDDIIRFGPLVGVATEVFESFNAIFRYCSIFSNHLAPSRDIAYQQAEQETVRHMLAGGWWATDNGEWTRAGPSVHSFIGADPMLRTLIGWGDTSVPPGKFLISFANSTTHPPHRAWYCYAPAAEAGQGQKTREMYCPEMAGYSSCHGHECRRISGNHR